MKEIRLWINDQEVRTKEGKTILEVANKEGISIPTLCYHPSVKAFGSCRMCAVEIEGLRGLPSACSTQVEDGMRIYTNTERVIEFRRQMLQLILERHPRNCLGCSKNGSCELQELVSAVGIEFSYEKVKSRDLPQKDFSTYFSYLPDLCIKCGRCVRVCYEIIGLRGVSFMEEQGQLEISISNDRLACNLCGACLDVCPVGAMSEKKEALDIGCELSERLTDIIADLYKKQLPVQKEASVCPLCSLACMFEFEITLEGKIQKIRRKERFIEEGIGCRQGRFLLKEYMNKDTRLERPLLKKEGSYVEIDWDQALKFLRERLLSYEKDQVGVITNGILTDEELYSLKELSSHIGLTISEKYLRISKMMLDSFGKSFSFEDIKSADCVLIIGADPYEGFPPVGPFIRMANVKGASLILAGSQRLNYYDLYIPYEKGKEKLFVNFLIEATKDSSRIELFSKELQIPYEILERLISLIKDSSSTYVLYGTELFYEKKEDELDEINRLLIDFSRLKDAKIGFLYAPGNWNSALMVASEESLKEMVSGRIKAVYVAMEDLQQESAVEKIKDMIEASDFTVVHSRSRLPIEVDLFLPLKGILEKSGRFSGKEISPILKAPEEARTVKWVVEELMKKGG